MTAPYPASKEAKAPTPGSHPPEKVENRDNVGTATPEIYPIADREDGDVTGADNRAPSRKQGSGQASVSGADAGGGLNPEGYDEDPQADGGHEPVCTDNDPKTGADAQVGSGR